MNLSDEVPLSLFTTVVGAILGAVLVPAGDALVNLAFGKRQRGIYGALLLFFAACGVWIIAEIFVELFVRAQAEVGWAVASMVALIFGLAALAFAVGFQQVPRGNQNVLDRSLARAMFFLITGNILWIFGEVVETFAWALRPNQPEIGAVALWIRLGFSLLAVLTFVSGAVSCWRIMPRS